MGINATNNLNRNELTSIAKQNVPNIPVVAPAYSSTGWTAGDFLYQSATGVNPAPSGVASVGGPITTLQATNVTVSNGGLFSAAQTLTSLFATTAVYTGPSTTSNSVFFNNTPSATASGGSNYCATLLNGNIVVAYYDAGAATVGYYYAIYDSSGGTVLAPTFIASNVGAAASMVGVVAESSGTFRIFYYTLDFGGIVVSNRYTSAGTFVNTTNRGVTAPRTSPPSTVRTIQLLNGNVVVAYWNVNIEPYVVGFNAANTASFMGQSLGGSSDNSAKGFALYPFPTTSTSISGGFGLTWWSSGNGTSYYSSFNPSGSAVSGTTGSPNTLYDSLDIIRLQDGSYMGGYGNSGTSLQISAFSLNTTTGALSTTGTTVSLSYNQGVGVKLIPMAGSGFAVLYVRSNVLYFRRSTGLTPSSTTLTSEFSIDSSAYPSTFCAACGTNAFIYPIYINGSSIQTFSGIATSVLTNGTAYIATSLVPPTTTFFGIAETTVSAGQTGNVIVSGTATANGSMPSITGTQYFDTTQTPMFGNKGFVTGRNFTLKGFE